MVGGHIRLGSCKALPAFEVPTPGWNQVYDRKFKKRKTQQAVRGLRSRGSRGLPLVAARYKGAGCQDKVLTGGGLSRESGRNYQGGGGTTEGTVHG